MTLTLDDERPVQTIPDVEAWSENFCLDGFDPDTGIAFWIHCGRWSKAPDLWREQVLLFLPGSDYLIHRAYGYRPNAIGPSGAALSIECEDPARQMRYRFRGPARRLTDAVLADAPVREGPVELLKFDMTFEATQPVWDFGSTEGEVWAHSHYEQPGRVTGTIELEDRTIAVSASAYRDHSRGPRDQTTLSGHCWIHAQFADWAFAVFSVRVLTDEGVKTGYEKTVIFQDDRIYDVEPHELPYLPSLDMPPSSYELTLKSELGTRVVKAEIRKSIVHSVAPRFDCFDGFTPGIANIGAYQQPSLFSWEGETVPGYTERTARL